MSFQAADSLKNRTFVGLIISQFLAGFNDQAIHAAAMFYAIHRGVLTEAQAISLMPILFYAPWAIFCTTSAYLADRFSKTTAIVVWKFSEIIISLLLTAGFVLGTVYDMDVGVWIVLSCVFWMGTHAAFFSPAKYGAMPEVLQTHVLSKGNGVLESSTFLANIFGTVSGGALSYLLHEREYWIGVILLVLSVIGAAASLLMAKLPPSDPAKKFSFIKPLTNGFRDVFGSRPLALSVMGIAFFVFMVAYMRSTMYMHGQTRVPPWDDFKTSLIVAAVALGVGLGSPLAGWLSGGKIELGLVPVGCVGMIASTVFAAVLLNYEAALVTALIGIGFFSGFYMVPLYSLLQHRAPKKSKGEIVAVSNFVNVTGAIVASLLFFVLVQAGRMLDVTPVIAQTDKVVQGEVTNVVADDHHQVKKLTIDDAGKLVTLVAEPMTLLKLPGTGIDEKDKVVVSQYQINAVTYQVVRLTGTPMATAYNNEGLPKYLFLGAGAMTLFILILLYRKLPDFLVRTLFWWRNLGKHQLKAVGMDNLPTSGSVILVTNCDRLESNLHMVSATDRHTVIVLAEKVEGREPGTFLRGLARRSSLLEVSGAGDGYALAQPLALKALLCGELLAVGVDGEVDDARLQTFIAGLGASVASPVIPVWCGAIANGKMRVVFGEPAAPATAIADLRKAVHNLGVWIRDNDATAGAGH